MIFEAEPINVWVFFKGRTINPYLFIWKNRRIKVESVNLVHTTKVGGKTFYHFSISSGGNFYRLRFDSKDLKWFMEETEGD